MTISDLIEKLKNLHETHGDIPIIIQSDEEGNYYNLARGVEFTFADEDFESTGESRDDVGPDAREVIVIYP